jgi:hypothetical protein
MMYMSKIGIVLVLIIAVAVISAGVFYLINSGNQGGTVLPSNSSIFSNTSPTLVLNAPSGTPAQSGQNVSDGTISFTIPSDFGLATAQEQILVRSYIPPCDPDFDYCLYYNGSAYEGTNFDSAGIRIEERSDLTTENLCLTTPPTGYSNFTPTSTTAGDYSISEFSPLGDAGAGHYAVGTLYRLWYDGDDTCYEFETRIGQTQFANYPSGTIQQFTATDQSALQSEMQNVLDGISLPSGETINFPQ